MPLPQMNHTVTDHILCDTEATQLFSVLMVSVGSKQFTRSADDGRINRI